MNRLKTVISISQSKLLHMHCLNGGNLNRAYNLLVINENLIVAFAIDIESEGSPVSVPLVIEWF